MPEAQLRRKYTVLLKTTPIRGLGSDGDQRAFGGAFYSGGGLFQLAPAAVTPRLSVAEGGNPLQFSVRPDALLYLSIFDVGGARSVHRWAYEGTVTVPCTFSTGETSAAAAFTASRVYLHTNGAGKLYPCPILGTDGSFEVFLANLYLDSLTATSDRVFWAVDGAVTSSPEGVTAQTLSGEIAVADVGSNVTSVTITGGELFATTQGGQLWSCAPADCRGTLRKVAEDGILETYHPLVSHTVAADDDSVYFVGVDSRSDAGAGTSRLMKVAR